MRIEGEKSYEVAAGREVSVVLYPNESGTLEITFELNVKNIELEWIVDIEFGTKKYEEYISASNLKTIKFDVDLKKGKKEIILHIKTPRAANVGDKMLAHLKYKDWEESVEVKVRQVIVAVKTIIGQESMVAKDIALKSEMNDYGVTAVFAPVNLKGYVFVETAYPDKLLIFTKKIKGVKGIVKGEMTVEEIKHYLTPPPVTSKISVGDIVELVEGPFKGEKAKIIQIYEDRDEIAVELFESVVPIPITVKADTVRVLERKEER